jgi:multimeric flavodoxin WrbA
MKIQLLIIWDSMTGGAKALAVAAAAGATEIARDEPGFATEIHHAANVTPEMMLSASGYLFVFPENLAAISGVMKSFFDRAYYPCLGQIAGRPFVVIVCAGSDGRNAVLQSERIATGWRLKKVAESIIVCTNAQTPEQILAPKLIAPSDLQRAYDIGKTIAAGLAMGAF